MSEAMKKKLTEWFPGDVKPVHVGVYIRKGELRGRIFSRWNGKCWVEGGLTFDEAGSKVRESYWQFLVWRGLAVKP